MPPEESSDFTLQAKKNDIDIIRLIAPTTSLDRASNICSKSSGYVYYISVKGITGAANLDSADAKQKVQELKGLTELPVVIGFGIKDAQSAISVKDAAECSCRECICRFSRRGWRYLRKGYKKNKGTLRSFKLNG